MDDPNAKYMEIVEQLKERFGKKVAPFHLPIIEDGKLTGYVNVVKMGGRKFTDDLGSYTERDIPEDLTPELEPCREQLMEAVAESDEVLMDKYFSGKNLHTRRFQWLLEEVLLSATLFGTDWLRSKLSGR